MTSITRAADLFCCPPQRTAGNAAPAIAAAVEELTAARAEIAALRRQVCRLTSGDEIEGDRLCQHHGADVAALALLSDERAAHAETSRDLDALLTALGAKVTPGGQTLAAGEARRVADGLRRAKRAAESAPSKCSCTHEAGDSWCLAHPTCAECGAFTPSCVDACADHVKPAPAVPARSEVPADVEAAIVSLVAAARDATNYEPDRATVADHLTAERFVKESVANLRASIAAEIDRARAEGRGESTAATATVARPISEWHEDRGSALWWRFPVEEPPYSGSPLDSDWPGYHTHWTPIVCPDEPHDQADADPASRGPIGGGS